MWIDNCSGIWRHSGSVHAFLASKPEGALLIFGETTAWWLTQEADWRLQHCAYVSMSSYPDAWKCRRWLTGRRWLLQRCVTQRVLANNVERFSGIIDRAYLFIWHKKMTLQDIYRIRMSSQNQQWILNVWSSLLNSLSSLFNHIRKVACYTGAKH